MFRKSTYPEGWDCNYFWISFQPCIIALETNVRAYYFARTMLNAEYFVDKAEQCFRLARLVKTPNFARSEIVTNLEALGNELMAKAEEMETVRQRACRKS
ncbi:MAG TPA: hypothetical protein VK825_06735 [Xanthobacteraceae bacterium]|nr:hypothetical protein [Xanthobacteraceae bacterium]